MGINTRDTRNRGPFDLGILLTNGSCFLSTSYLAQMSKEMCSR